MSHCFISLDVRATRSAARRASVVASGRQRLLLQPREPRAGAEPALEELLADPVLHLVMRRDGVSPGELRAVIAAARARRRARNSCLCPA
jgi:hypothetical protein